MDVVVGSRVVRFGAIWGHPRLRCRVIAARCSDDRDRILFAVCRLLDALVDVLMVCSGDEGVDAVYTTKLKTKLEAVLNDSAANDLFAVNMVCAGVRHGRGQSVYIIDVTPGACVTVNARTLLHLVGGVRQASCAAPSDGQGQRQERPHANDDCVCERYDRAGVSAVVARPVCGFVRDQVACKCSEGVPRTATEKVVRVFSYSS